MICADCQQRDVCDLAGKDAPLLTGCDASHGTWAFDRLRLDRMTADRDALRAELERTKEELERVRPAMELADKALECSNYAEDHPARAGLRAALERKDGA